MKRSLKKLQEIYAYIQKCDNVIIASPLYFSELTGKLLDVGSRLQTYFCARFFRKEEPVIKAKKGAVVLVGGGDGHVDTAYRTACILLHHMNCYNIHQAVYSHNTNERPAAADENVLLGIKSIVDFLQDKNSENKIFLKEVMMKLQYKRATIEDIDILTETRVEVLRAANQLSEQADMSVVKEQSYYYYKKALADGTHTAYLVFDGDCFAGAGGISFYQVMPTYHNPSGRKAYIMNMYTAPGYRRRGIAYHTLDLLVQEAKDRGITAISLEATEMGRPLYKKYGFVNMKDEMELLF